MAIARVIKGISKEKQYQELVFEQLQSRRWFRKLSVFYKLIKNESQSYLYHLTPKSSTSYSTRNSKNLAPIKANHSFLKNTLFSIHHHRMEQIRFKNLLFFFLKTLQITNLIRPCPGSSFNVPNSLGLTFYQAACFTPFAPM